MTDWYFTGYARQSIGLPAPYQGPGDIVQGAGNFWGLRAYANATIGNKCIRLQYNGANAKDYNTVTSGIVDIQSILNDFNNFGGPITVVTIYDQVGSIHLDTIDTSNPTFTLDDGTLNGLPSVVLAQSPATVKGIHSSSNISVMNLPFTVNLVTLQRASGSQSNTYQTQNAANNNNIVLGNDTGGANNAFLYDGTNIHTATANDGTWNFLQGVIPSGGAATEIFAVNASQNTGLTSTGAINYGGGFAAIGNPGVSGVDGSWSEMAAWPIAFSTGQLTSMYNNVHAWYGVF